MSHVVNGRLGLAIDGLQVTGILTPLAESYGFAVGDRLCAVNGMSIVSQEHFHRVLQHAMHEHSARGSPVTVTVLPKAGSDVNYTPPLRQKDGDCCGGDDLGRDGDRLGRPAYGYGYQGYQSSNEPMPYWDRYRVPERSPLYNYEMRTELPLSYGHREEIPYGYTRRQKGEWDC